MPMRRPGDRHGRVAMIAQALLLAGLLAGCGSPGAGHVARKSTRDIYGTGAGDQVQLAALPPNAAPTAPAREGRGIYKIGDPYQIDGTWYYPKEDFGYVETGIASWYGEDFHGKRTANGESYDMYAISAAHRTLQMPCVVRVTNLENGRALLVRVNDRGPYARGRILDLSRRAAELLGMYGPGTAKVRVEVMPEESRMMKEAALRGQRPDLLLLASAAPAFVASGPLPAALAADPPPPPEPVLDERVRVVPVGASSIFVQAGAFANLDNARRVRDSLDSLAPTAIMSVSTTGQRLYRVRVGPLATVDDADAALERVVKRGYPQARIVVE